MPYQREPQGAFLSALDWLDRLAEPGKNILAGQPGGAGRQLVDIVSDILDAPLPTDVFPHVSRPEDFVKPSSLLGLGDEGFAAGAANFVGDVALNPSTYIPAGWVGKGLHGLGALASKGAELLPEAAQPAVAAVKGLGRDAGVLARKLAGEQRVAPETRLLADDASAVAGNVHMAQSAHIAEMMKGLATADAEAAGQIMHNIRFDPASRRPVDLIDPSGILNMSERAKLFLKNAPEGVNPEAVQGMIDRYPEFAKTQFEEAVGGGAFHEGPGVTEYFPRQFKGLREKDVGADSFGRIKSYRGRKLETSQDVLNFMKENPEVRLGYNAGEVLSARAEQASRLAERGTVGKEIYGRLQAGTMALPEELAALQRTHGEDYVQELLSHPFALADEKRAGYVRSALNEMSRSLPEDAQVLGDLYNGLPPRHPITQMLSTAIKPFKRFAVFGAIIPKISTNVSNAVSGVTQVAMNPEARFFTGQAARDLLGTIGGAVDDGIEKYFGTRLAPNEFAALEEAARTSGGSVKAMLDKIQDPMMKAALRHGVLGDNMVTAEQMIESANKVGWHKAFANLMEAPAVIFKGVEQRMRYGLFKAMMEKAGAEGGEAAARNAARVVSDTFYSYRVSSKENRLARDIIPFWQFTAKAIPQSAKFFAEKPVAAVALAQLAGAGNGEEIYPYMEGKLNLPLGRDQEGNQQYASSFRLPFEALGAIPNPSADFREFGKQVRQNVVGASNPLLKTAFAATSGIDPYFGTPYGSYDKIPLIGSAGKAGQAYNMLAGTGAIQFIDSPLKYLQQVLDERHTTPARLLDALTGVNVVSVDPNLAAQQHLQAELETSPGAKRFVHYYNTGGDTEIDRVIKEFEAAKKRIKEKRQAETDQAKQAASATL